MSDPTPPTPDPSNAARTNRTKDVHPEFPSMTRSDLYEQVVRMFLDCRDDAQVAAALSEQFSKHVTSVFARSLRREAARAAITETNVEVKRRWIHRYRKATLNNIVKEYMFLENKQDFLRAKHDLAREMHELSRQNTPTPQLWIAVNESVGRNNADLDVVHALIAYGAVAEKMEKIVSSLAKISNCTSAEQMRRLGVQLNLFRRGRKTPDKAEDARNLARVLMQKEDAVGPQDVDYLDEWVRLSEHPLPPNASINMQILFGADLEGEDLSLLELVLSSRDRLLSVVRLKELVHIVREGPLLEKIELEALREYSTLHLAKVEPSAAGKPSNNPDAQTVEALKHLHAAAEDHLDIQEVKRFFKPEELAQAKASRLSEAQLKSQLDRLNSLASFDSVKSVMTFLFPKARQDALPFPTERYLFKRFGRLAAAV